MLLCTLITAASPALGASREDHNNCNSDDPNRNIVGCSKIL
jgi:hypothetical protein